LYYILLYCIVLTLVLGRRHLCVRCLRHLLSWRASVTLFSH